MSFRCGPCGQNALDIVRSIELGPDDYNDEVTLQIMRCRSCRGGAVALYEESRRGSDERWSHVAWPASDEMIAAVLADPRGYAKYLTGDSFRVIR